MKKLLIYILPIILLASCSKNLSDYNVDDKSPQAVTAGSLFGNSLKQLTDNVTTPSVNINVFRFWIQQWATTTYQDEPRYNITTRNIPLNFWTPMYREVLQDLKESKRLTLIDATISPEVKNNRLAVIDIAAVYTWSVLVNTWGDIPYSEALTDVNRPKYDKAADIYADLFKRLDAAAALITTGSNFGGSDLLYHDDSEAWKKFAYSLKLKLAITLADADEAQAKSIILADADKAFTSNADNAAFEYLSQTPNNNPVSNNINPLYTSRMDYVASSVVVNKMNELSDPRRSFYFSPVDGKYVGGFQGVNNTYADYSHPSEKVIASDFEALLLDYAEVEFILAEASARWGILGTATDHYSKAISASIIYWGGTQIQATTYLANPLVSYLSANGTYKEKIGTQKYLALYNRGYDAWTEWRRLDYPVLVKANQALSEIPLRVTYPTSERTLNKANVESAAAAIGGDAVGTKVFWDKF